MLFISKSVFELEAVHTPAATLVFTTELAPGTVTFSLPDTLNAKSVTVSYTHLTLPTKA